MAFSPPSEHWSAQGRRNLTLEIEEKTRSVGVKVAFPEGSLEARDEAEYCCCLADKKLAVFTFQ